MCGLCGMMGPGVIKEDLEFLKQLSYVCGLRGTDGTGIVQGSVTNNRKTVIVEKDDVDINFFQKYHCVAKTGKKDLFNKMTDNMFLVHVRAATLGGLSHANTHPFEFSDIIGMHNGTLRDKRYIDNTFTKEKREQKTDSELLFRDINERGLLTVLKELDPVDNAYALVIYNKKTGLVDFVRNEKRTLWIGVNTKRNVTYWASEEGMLNFVADRVGVDIKTWYFKPNVIYSFKPSQCLIGELPDWDSYTPLPNHVKVRKKEETREVAANTQNFVQPERFHTGGKISKKQRKRQQREAARIANEAKEVAKQHRSNILPLIQPEQRRQDLLTAESKKRDEKVKDFLRKNKGRQYDAPCEGCGHPLTLVEQWYYHNSSSNEDLLCAECSELRDKMRVH